ncbi:YidC/Oxa1 family membrane protein insertase [Paenibacillus sp. HB172176]|uniref:YidC/Oxa1 family membrane protein insertase n=1 Tax=Paenibacillus sp. HB172176 TaxID=2493690 RepID=UPI00143C66EF|nr:YidC/Oxa1 family membrane protein insertase [Paenibacillus sp. HB172176]
MLFRNVNRKWLTVISLIVLMGILAGCGNASSHTAQTEDLHNGNFWEKNVVYYFAKSLDTFADWFGGSYVLAILTLTIIVRSLILPLTIKQVRSSKAMQALQPQLNEIKKKYKDDRQKQQEETMKLFQANKVNPMAGCLPLIIQMPVFIALYNSINWNENIRLEKLFGFVLGEPSPWYFLPILAALTTFVQSKMMQKQQTQAMPGMAMIMTIFPVLIFVMSLSFPAALPLYWVFSNLYTIIQNYFLYVRSSNKGKEVLAK